VRQTVYTNVYVAHNRKKVEVRAREHAMSTFTIDDSVTELTPEEGRKLFDNLARAELGVSGEEFLRRLIDGDIPEEWSEDAVSRLEILTPFAA